MCIFERQTKINTNYNGCTLLLGNNRTVWDFFFFLCCKLTNGNNSIATLGPPEWSFTFLMFELQE